MAHIRGVDSSSLSTATKLLPKVLESAISLHTDAQVRLGRDFKLKLKTSPFVIIYFPDSNIARKSRAGHVKVTREYGVSAI